MARVEPIRDLKKLNEIMETLAADRTRVGERRYLLFATGINLGRRVGDLLRLKVGDVKDRRQFEIREQKTGKDIPLLINDDLFRIYRERLKDRADDEFLFQSREKNRITGKPQAINPKTALRDLKYIQKLGCFPKGYNLGTHTMRKTYGYWYYQRYHDAEILRLMFNHSSITITQKYIGIEKDKLIEAQRKTAGLYRVDV